MLWWWHGRSGSVLPGPPLPRWIVISRALNALRSDADTWGGVSHSTSTGETVKRRKTGVFRSVQDPRGQSLAEAVHHRRMGRDEIPVVFHTQTGTLGHREAPVCAHRFEVI